MKDEKIFDKISSAKGLAGNVVFKIMQDSSGVYWICTGTGISRYQQLEGVDETTKPWRSFFNYSSINGLGTDSVFQMIIDHSSTVWMTSNRGISSVPLTELNDLATNKNRRAKVDAKFYNQNDGLNSAGANSTALSMRDKNGRIWFTMVDGFVAPERLRFKHMLVGFDTDYSQPTQNRTVSYTNLPPGDCYMAACGIPTPNANHVMTMIEFARGIQQDLEEYNKDSPIKFSMRIGLNSGPVVAGVIGTHKFIYDVWGDTVNVACRMEPLCTPGKIRITDAVRKALQEQVFGTIDFEEEVDVRGKGIMHTYEL